MERKYVRTHHIPFLDRCIFRVLEPKIDTISARADRSAGRETSSGSRKLKRDWFRIYSEFYLPSESFDVAFLRRRILILCKRGFEIMDLLDFKSVTIPSRDDPRLAGFAKRCESCRAMGMFRVSEEEFLFVL
ncbi:Dbl domain-containing protein [Mycena sanguinolenta]|uniref:Dbl domain-containing protein n=1 Tax=Mycena sanguinolenta TaxID=230812 RepID=A0A8H6ZBB5_9AGAR|nr:Dbl domain-containing protein [Mycena sanguinolenta]